MKPFVSNVICNDVINIDDENDNLTPNLTEDKTNRQEGPEGEIDNAIITSRHNESLCDFDISTAEKVSQQETVSLSSNDDDSNDCHQYSQSSLTDIVLMNMYQYLFQIRKRSIKVLK